MKVLIFGGHGLVGKELTEILVGQGCEVIAPTRNICDISKAGKASEMVAETCPDAVVNLAAQTDVDGCEKNESQAWDINSFGALAVSLACARMRVKPYLVHVSTDYVFDGNSNVPYLPGADTNPLSLYGVTKASGEKAVLEMSFFGGGALVLRTSWVYGRFKASFIDAVLRRMTAEEGIIEVCNDQSSTPTRASDLAQWISMAIQGPRPRGIMHFSGLGTPVSRCEWAKYFVAVARSVTGDPSYDPSRIVGVSTSSLPPRAAVRPSFSALNTDSAMAAVPFGPLWLDATQEHVEWMFK